ncbi:MAG: hypothetical protein ACE5H5_05530, partial [Nitrospinota bacterium]
MAPETFVQVAFALPIEKTFTYAVPPPMVGRVEVGSRVMAPLGSRLVSGFVTEVRRTPPPELGDELKAVEACLDEEPMVGPALMGLARWVAGYYCAGVGEVLKAALPAGMERKAERTVLLAKAGRAALAEGHLTGPPKRVAEHLETCGPAPIKRLAAALGTKEAQVGLQEGLERGWFVEEVRLAPPRLAPRARRLVRLARGVDAGRTLELPRSRSP